MRVCGLEREEEHPGLRGGGGAVFHRLVGDDRRGRGVPEAGAAEPRLPHVRRVLHAGFLHDKRRVQCPGERGQLRERLFGEDRGSSLALHRVHADVWGSHRFHVDPFRCLCHPEHRGLSGTSCVFSKCTYIFKHPGLQIREDRGAVELSAVPGRPPSPPRSVCR